MKSISLLFVVHKPWRLKTYRFFNMGVDHNYLDDAANRSEMQSASHNCYEPVNELLLKLIKANKGKFRASFYLSGTVIEQMRSYAPLALEGFRTLANTGDVEFVAGSYSNSLSSMVDFDEFERDVKRHSELIYSEFGQHPTTFCNTALVYSDKIGEWVTQMGFKAMVTEGAKHVLGWKSPNYVYANALNYKLHILLRNWRLSDDIAFRFSNMAWNEYPLTTDKVVRWIADDATGETVNLVMDYDAFGLWNTAQSGIFEFIEHLPKAALATKELIFSTVAESASTHQPIGVLYSQHPISWADEERDLSAWLGNELQAEAFRKLYDQRERVLSLNDPDFNHVWDILTSADHFYYMATKWFSSGEQVGGANPFGSSYEAFINYMNILSDFIIELDRRANKVA